MEGQPPLRLINLWRRILDDGEVYRSPGRPRVIESLAWGVMIQREHPLQEAPFWYFLTTEHADIARGYVEQYDRANPEAATRAAAERVRRLNRYTRNVDAGRAPENNGRRRR